MAVKPGNRGTRSAVPSVLSTAWKRSCKTGPASSLSRSTQEETLLPPRHLIFIVRRCHCHQSQRCAQLLPGDNLPQRRQPQTVQLHGDPGWVHRGNTGSGHSTGARPRYSPQALARSVCAVDAIAEPYGLLLWDVIGWENQTRVAPEHKGRIFALRLRIGPRAGNRAGGRDHNGSPRFRHGHGDFAHSASDDRAPVSRDDHQRSFCSCARAGPVPDQRLCRHPQGVTVSSGGPAGRTSRRTDPQLGQPRDVAYNYRCDHPGPGHSQAPSTCSALCHAPAS